MNKIGIYYAYWTHDWDADFHPFIDKVADIGFDVLEVNGGTVGHMTAEERQALKAHADDRNITLSYCVGLPKQYDLASEEKSVRDNGIAFLQTMAKAIGEMGGGNLGGIIYSYWPATLPTGRDGQAALLGAQCRQHEGSHQGRRGQQRLLQHGSRQPL